MRCVLGTLVVCLVVAAAPSHAELPVIPLGDLEAFANHAGMVVVGRCLSAESAWDASGTRIMTTVEYEIERVVKSDGESATPTRIVLEEHGGTVGTITQAVVGGPTFAPGTRDLLFLVPAQVEGRWRTYALGRGQLPVSRDAESGRDLVRVGADPRESRMLELDGVVRLLERRMP